VLAGFIYSNSRQTSRNLHDGEITEVLNDMRADKTHGELFDQAVKLATYVRNPVEEAHELRGLLFAQYIGGSIASAMVNMTAAVPSHDAVPVAVGRREGRCQPDGARHQGGVRQDHGRRETGRRAAPGDREGHRGAAGGPPAHGA
jgi:hypothetical protein